MLAPDSPPLSAFVFLSPLLASELTPSHFLRAENVSKHHATHIHINTEINSGNLWTIVTWSPAARSPREIWCCDSDVCQARINVQFVQFDRLLQPLVLLMWGVISSKGHFQLLETPQNESPLPTLCVCVCACACAASSVILILRL